MKQIEAKIFGGRRFKGVDALRAAGFSPSENGHYIYKTSLDGFPFNVILTANEKGEIDGKLLDPDTSDDYVNFRLDNAKGYAIEVKEAYKDLLRGLRESLFEKEGALYAQRDLILEKTYEMYGDAPVTKWEDHPDFLILEHRGNKKWYALFMAVPKSKLGEGEGEIAVLNVKLDPQEIDWLVTRDGYYRAYHMNKKYWITIALDGRLSLDEVLSHIARSRELTSK